MGCHLNKKTPVTNMPIRCWCSHVRIYNIDMYAKCVQDVDRDPIREAGVVYARGEHETG
jgi:hypothetical protein